MWTSQYGEPQLRVEIIILHPHVSIAEHYPWQHLPNACIDGARRLTCRLATIGHSSPAYRQRRKAKQSELPAISAPREFGFATVPCYDNVRFSGMQAEIMGISVRSGINLAAPLPDTLGH